MKRGACFLATCLVVLSVNTTRAVALTGTGHPLRYVSSCELDFNNDGESDIAFLVETLRGRELIVLLRAPTGYTAFELSKVTQSMHLSCHFGRSIRETSAGRNDTSAGQVHNTLGTYIRLTQPEGSSVVYFWNGSGFTEVWTSD